MTDTIAAIATAVSNAGISIIRVSGSEAIQIVDEIFVTKGGKHILNNVASHTIHYGFIQEQDEMIDEATSFCHESTKETILRKRRCGN